MFYYKTHFPSPNLAVGIGLVVNTHKPLPEPMPTNQEQDPKGANVGEMWFIVQ